MNQNFDIGNFFKERLGHYKESPPEGLWEKIASNLSYDPHPYTPHPSRSLKYFYFAVGLFITGVAVLLIYTFSHAPNKIQSVENKTIKNIPSATIQATPKVETSNEVQPTHASNFSAVLKNTPSLASKNAKPSTSKAEIIHDQPTNNKESDPIAPKGSTDNNMLEGNTKNNTYLVDERPTLAATPTTDSSIYDSITHLPEDNPEDAEPIIQVEQLITACKGEELTLNAGEGTGHRWSTGQSGQTLVYTANEETRLIANYKDLKGRKVTAIYNISLLNCSIFVPRAFSPNDDGHNDLYRIKAEGISNFEMKIFSKWGEMVFHTRDLESGWNGMQKGNPAPAGIYIYQIHYTDPNNQIRAVFGTLTLLR